MLFVISVSVAMGLSLMLPGISTADLKITSTVTTSGVLAPTRANSAGVADSTGQPSPETTKTITAYFKGDQARVEVTGEPVTIYDAGKKVVLAVSRG